MQKKKLDVTDERFIDVMGWVVIIAIIIFMTACTVHAYHQVTR